MIIRIRTGASVDPVIQRLSSEGFSVRVIDEAPTAVLRVGDMPGTLQGEWSGRLKAMSGVEEVICEACGYPLVALTAGHSVVRVGGAEFGGSDLVLIAGPCTAESEEQVRQAARAVRDAGAQGLRGGAFKPTTSPYSFKGHGEQALRWMRQAADEFELILVTEVMDPRNVALGAQYADVLQVGARNMQNFDLLREVGRSPAAVLLKRSPSARYEEWLLAAEHVAEAGNDRIILCERGIRTFERETRNTLDLAAVPALKTMSRLPICVDPSHASGRRELIAPLSLAAVAAGADALLIEVHPDPESAWKDGRQSLSTEEFADLAPRLNNLRRAVTYKSGPALSSSNV